MRFIAIAGAMISGLISLSAAHAADLSVISAAAVRSTLADVPQRFKAATGHSVTFAYSTAGGVRDKVVAGEKVDVVIVPPVQLADLVAKGFVTDGTRKDLGLVRLGVAVKSGAPRPSFGTPATFKQTLLSAPSLGLADGATGATTGVYFAKLLKDLDIADAVKGHLKLYPDGTAAMEALAKGEVALAAGQISEIKPVHGIDLAGPLPEELQLKTTYAAGLAAKSADPAAARSLIDFLASEQMTPTFTANGFDRP